MADPKYYMDDKAILEMMYQQVYGGQLPPPPDDSIMDEYMEFKKAKDKAQSEASISAIRGAADVVSVPYGVAKESVMKASAPIAANMLAYPEIRARVDDEPLYYRNPIATQRYERKTPEKQLKSRLHDHQMASLPIAGPLGNIGVQLEKASMLDEKMQELYEQMTPEQQAKVNTKLREQSVEKIDSAIDSYPGDF